MPIHKKISSTICWLYVLEGFLILIGGCNTKEITSRWRNQEIVVDGQNTEWRDAFDYRDEKSHIVLGMVNDQNNLYLCLSTQDMKTSAMILHSGITVWLDSDGGDKKNFGIRFPLAPPMDAFAISPTPGQKLKPMDFEKIIENIPREIEILSSDEAKGEIIMADVADKMGIAARLGINRGVLVYELKVPLTNNGMLPFQVATDLSHPIGVGFETGKMGMDKIHDGNRSKGGMNGRGGPPGGMGGMPRGKMDGIHGGRPGGMAGGEQRPEPLELWTKVKLSYR